MQGVYKIENTKNKKIYIGSSKNIENRIKTHKRNLQKGCHHSVKLQRAWDQVSNSNVFTFEIIEEVNDSNDLKVREQYYIDYYDSYHKGYNCTSKVDDPRYTRKSINKKESELETVELYNDFLALYNPKRISFRGWNIRRLLNGKLKYPTYNIILCCVKWFFDTYPENEYELQICRRLYQEIGSICLFVSYKKQEFAKYNYVNKQIILDDKSTDKTIAFYHLKDRDNAINYQVRGVAG